MPFISSNHPIITILSYSIIAEKFYFKFKFKYDLPVFTRVSSIICINRIGTLFELTSTRIRVTRIFPLLCTFQLPDLWPYFTRYSYLQYFYKAFITLLNFQINKLHNFPAIKYFYSLIFAFFFLKAPIICASDLI